MLSIEQTREVNELTALNQDIQDWHASHFPHEFKPFDPVSMDSAFRNILDQKDSFAFVAKLDNIPIGYILCFIKIRSENAFQYKKSIMLIDQIMVKSEYRNKGIGKKLIAEVEKLAKQLHISDLQLDFWEANKLASHFFTNSGFKTFRIYMEKHLI